MKYKGLSMEQASKALAHRTRSIIAWSIFDWANSPFPTLILTFVFATYFTQVVAVNKIIGTAEWGGMIAIAGLIIAIVSPIVGAIADARGSRKPWLLVFSIILFISTALLWYTKPSSHDLTWGLGCVALGTIGFEVGTVFYNAMLRDIAPSNYIGRISGWAWGLGYAGGLVALSLVLFLFVQPKVNFLHLDNSSYENIRIVGPFAALWLFIFALPLFFFTKESKNRKLPIRMAIRTGLSELWQTLKTLPKEKTIFLFLIARMLYIDGLNTLFAFGGIYAAGTFHMDFNEILKFGITLNVTAGIGAAGFAWLDDWFGPKKTILIALVALTASGITILLLHSVTWFWIVALFMGLFMGPIQAASRSMMARLAPPEKMSKMFGLYALSGKATAFIGPWCVALLTLQFDSQRIGMTSIIVLLVIGTILLFKVPFHD